MVASCPPLSSAPSTCFRHLTVRSPSLDGATLFHPRHFHSQPVTVSPTRTVTHRCTNTCCDRHTRCHNRTPLPTLSESQSLSRVATTNADDTFVPAHLVSCTARRALQHRQCSATRTSAPREEMREARLARGRVPSRSFAMLQTAARALLAPSSTRLHSATTIHRRRTVRSSDRIPRRQPLPPVLLSARHRQSRAMRPRRLLRTLLSRAH